MGSSLILCITSLLGSTKIFVTQSVNIERLNYWRVCQFNQLEGFKMKSLFLLFLLLASGFSSAINAAGNTFDPATNTLTMDSVTVTGDRVYSNVVIRIDKFTVLGVGSSTPVDDGGGISETCGAENFTIAKHNAIQVGMSLDQVNQIIGCESDPGYTVRGAGFEKHVWLPSPPLKSILVYFDQSNLKVTGSLLDSFKVSSGF